MEHESLVTYVRDHLGGSVVAIGLLTDLREQACNEQLKSLAAELIVEVEQDRDSLEGFVSQFDQSNSIVKEAGAWLAHKVSRLKLQLNQPLGSFEAVELLFLGVTGKRSLWGALKAVETCDCRFGTLDFGELIKRADDQLARLELMRIELAPLALCGSATDSSSH